MMENKLNRLSIETNIKTRKAEAVIAGTIPDILFNLLALTVQVCEETGIPPEVWTAMLPGNIKVYKDTILKGKTAVGFNPFR